jgi:hypothetical protein
MLTQGSQAKISEAILFLLHFRPQDMTRVWEPKSLRVILQDVSFHEYTFNDRVMQSLIELDWIREQLADKSKGAGTKHNKSMSLDYALFLSLILVSRTASRNLKASACRTIIGSADSSIHFQQLIPAVMKLMHGGGFYLKTYATVTLVNLSHNQEAVKNEIMEKDIVPLMKEHLDCNDKDLVYYTLVLITSLSKSDHHRSRMHKPHSIVTAILRHLPIESADLEEGLFPTIAECASVIGQLCNNEEILIAVLSQRFGVEDEEKESVLDRIKALYTKVSLTIGTRLFKASVTKKMYSRLMFVMKQFYAKPIEHLIQVTAQFYSDKVWLYLPDRREAASDIIPFIAKYLRTLVPQSFWAQMEATPSSRSLAQAPQADLREEKEEELPLSNEAEQDCANSAALLLSTFGNDPLNIKVMAKEDLNLIISGLLFTKHARDKQIPDALRDRLNQLHNKIPPKTTHGKTTHHRSSRSAAVPAT